MLDVNPTYRTLLAVDTERSSGRGDVAMMRNRAVLFEELREACVESGIDWSACSLQDIGDGKQLIAGVDMPKPQFLHPLMRNLALRLRAHNRIAGAPTRIRVRTALHAGEVHLSDGQFAGSSLETLSRLLDAPPLKQALRNAPESVTVALVVSEHIHESVVRHGYVGIDPEAYEHIIFGLKGQRFSGWLHLPEGGPPNGTAPAETSPRDDGNAGHVQAAPPTADPVTGWGNIDATNVVTGNATVGEVIGSIGNRIDHVTGDIHVGGVSPRPPELPEQLADLRRSLAEMRRTGRIDAETFAEIESELRTADLYVRAADESGRNKFVRAMRKVKGLVEDVAELAAKVVAIISTARGAR